MCEETNHREDHKSSKERSQNVGYGNNQGVSVEGKRVSIIIPYQESGVYEFRIGCGTYYPEAGK
jgi:hypothetical protein